MRSTPAIFIDAIVVKCEVQDGQVVNRPFYAAIGVTLDGERNTLELGPSTGRTVGALDRRSDAAERQPWDCAILAWASAMAPLSAWTWLPSASPTTRETARVTAGSTCPAAECG